MSMLCTYECSRAEWSHFGILEDFPISRRVDHLVIENLHHPTNNPMDTRAVAKIKI